MTEWDAYLDGYTAGTIGASSRETAALPEHLRAAHTAGWVDGNEVRKVSDR